MKKLTVGSCFSGIGGLELGLEWTGGFETKWQIEFDPYASRVLAKHWPNVKRYSDIRDVVRPEPVDLICGGFPCQDVSLAGKRAGLEGKRSTLWSEMFRLVCEIRPRWVLAENVPGLLSSDDGRFFGNILRDLAGGGYDAEWNMLSASAVGAFHKRERVFILAYPSDGGLQGIFPITSDGYKSIFESPNKVADGCFNGTLQKDRRIWPSESRVRGVVNGIPNRTHRLMKLGNSVVPQVAQRIGEMILEKEFDFRKMIE